MNICNGHLGSRDQVELIEADGVEVILKLWKLPCAEHALGIYKERRGDFFVGVLRSMQIQHERDQGTHEPGTLADEQRKACPRDLARPVEVQNA
jgi:hypothetical protein